ncbi:MAG: T9SS type A sorting domain-containing protein, partial [Ignavibacteriota bacterium]
IDAEHTPADYFAQLFEGGALSEASRGYNARVIPAAPMKGGVHIQGWAYGAATYNWIMDYMLAVKTATGEDLPGAHTSWLSQIFRAYKHGLMPNRFEIDPNGDFGGRVGAVAFRNFAYRLAYGLAGTPDGPGAQHFAYEEIVKTSPLADFPDYLYQDTRKPPEWEDFYFTDINRPSTEVNFPPYYSGFGPVYPQGGQTNGALPYFMMRSDWGPNATWASFHGGSAFYDDHQHTDAGHIQIKHGNDYVVVDAANWKGDTASNGIIGDSQNSQYDAAAAANTLFFDDYGEYQRSDTDMQADGPVFCGGQSRAGIDEVIAAEMTDMYSYVRSDLSTAYNVTSDTEDVGIRRLVYFYRSFSYIRPANIFVVFDQTKALASSNPQGEYRRHIRWHFPNIPIVTGNSLSMQQHDSRVNMSFLLPDNARIKPVSELENPDPCVDIMAGCTRYGDGGTGFNSGTWRVEVSDPAASRTTPFLTVIQPTFITEPGMTTTKVSSAGESMIGALVSQPKKGSYLILFNNGAGQTPTPITSVSFDVSNPANVVCILSGMKPGAKYSTAIAGNTITVTETSGSGPAASNAGVLQFGTTSSVANSSRTAEPTLEANYPNPFGKFSLINFTLPEHQHVTLTLQDALGRTIRTLVDADLDAGANSARIETADLVNGMYFYTLRSGDFSTTRECVVMK